MQNWCNLGKIGELFLTVKLCYLNVRRESALFVLVLTIACKSTIPSKYRVNSKGEGLLPFHSHLCWHRNPMQSIGIYLIPPSQFWLVFWCPEKHLDNQKRIETREEISPRGFWLWGLCGVAWLEASINSSLSLIGISSGEPAFLAWACKLSDGQGLCSTN